MATFEVLSSAVRALLAVIIVFALAYTFEVGHQVSLLA
jgi:hypothetical protein